MQCVHRRQLSLLKFWRGTLAGDHVAGTDDNIRLQSHYTLNGGRYPGVVIGTRVAAVNIRYHHNSLTVSSREGMAWNRQ